MISFESHKEDAERWLSYKNPNTPSALIRALEIIVELCERGQQLEAENFDLKNQLREALERC
jgi:hypothetical protein